MNKIFTDKDVIDSGKFIFGIAVLFILFNFLFSLFPIAWFEYFYAKITIFILGIFGITGTIEYKEPVLIFLELFSLPIGISYLCTGLLEIIVVWSAIIASFGIEIKKRAIGVVAGTITLVIFNIIRIVGSILIIGFFGLGVGEFSHDILFRIFLLIAVAGFYYVWFMWATKQKFKWLKWNM